MTNDEVHLEEGDWRGSTWTAHRAARSDIQYDHRNSDVHGVHAGR